MPTTSYRPDPPLLCKGASDRRPDHSRDADSEEQPGQGGRKIICTQCGQTVTTTGARTTVGGQHRHVFCNPGGFVFDIGCFASAPGCRNIGQRTTEFTWFPGYSWKVAVCGGCLVQLGWHYAAEGGGAFFGIILERVSEEEDK